MTSAIPMQYSANWELIKNGIIDLAKPESGAPPTVIYLDVVNNYNNPTSKANFGRFCSFGT